LNDVDKLYIRRYNPTKSMDGEEEKFWLIEAKLLTKK